MYNVHQGVALVYIDVHVNARVLLIQQLEVQRTHPPDVRNSADA